jgi:hypothetical protein
MLRLIYISPTLDYQHVDADSIHKIADTEAKLKHQGADIVCLVDYQRQFIFKKNDQYSYHRDFIEDLIFGPIYGTGN